MNKKKCKQCNQIKKYLDFGKDKYTKDGYTYLCKICKNKNQRGNFIKNHENYVVIQQRYKDKHPDKIKEHQKKYHDNNPWMKHLVYAGQRCNNSNCEAYKYYGGRGIKCLITKEEMRELWFRDKAWLLSQPSIDRKDNDGNYEYDNCQFIEKIENFKRAVSKPVLQFDKNNNFIKEWKSASDAGRGLNICIHHISCCARNEPKNKSAGSFKWRLKEAQYEPRKNYQ